MRVAIVPEYENSAVGILMRQLCEEVKRQGIDATLTDRDVDLDYLDDNFDIAHFGWVDLFPPGHYNTLTIPITLNVWGPALDITMRLAARLRTLDPARVVVDDVYTLQVLGQLGIHEYEYIPLAFNHDLKPLPEPEGPFTVGVFGNEYRSKRFEIVEAACSHLPDVSYYPCIQDPDRTLYHLDPVRDVYRHIHVYAHASIIDTNSMPAREALFCGRPVIATRNDGLMRIIRHGENGMFFDGTVNDLVRKIKIVKSCYGGMKYEADRTYPETTVQEAANDYIAMWQTAVGEY